MQENNADRSICFTEVMMWPMTCEIGEEKICRRTKQTEAYVLQKSVEWIAGEGRAEGFRTDQADRSICFTEVEACA